MTHNPSSDSIQLVLKILPGRYAVCRFDPSDPRPRMAPESSFYSITRTADELSVVLDEAQVQQGWQAERGWSAIQVAGQLDFNLTGILASLAVPLADAAISIFAISTYDTDIILVREADLQHARAVLETAGFIFCEG